MRLSAHTPQPQFSAPIAINPSDEDGVNEFYDLNLIERPISFEALEQSGKPVSLLSFSKPDDEQSAQAYLYSAKKPYTHIPKKEFNLLIKDLTEKFKKYD